MEKIAFTQSSLTVLSLVSFNKDMTYKMEIYFGSPKGSS